MPEDTEKDRVIIAPRRSLFWTKVLGVLAILSAYSLFHSMTVYLGLTESKVYGTRCYKMTRMPNSWEKFWGEKSLELWKNSWVNQKDLAVSLVKGRTLVGLDRKEILDEMGVSQEGLIIFPIPNSSFEESCSLFIVFNDEGTVNDAYIESMN